MEIIQDISQVQLCSGWRKAGQHVLQGIVISNMLGRDGKGIRSLVGRWGGESRLVSCFNLSRYVDHGDLQNTLGKNIQDGKGMCGG